MSDNIKKIFDFFIVAGALQGFFLAFILFSIKRGNKKANRMLAFLLISFSISILHVVTSKIIQLFFKSIINIDGPFQLLFGPFFYFYVKYLTDRSYKFSKKELLHFIPFILISLFLFFNSLNVIKINFDNQRVSNIILWGITSIFLWSYLIVVLKKVIHYKRNIKNTFSNIDKINLNWIWYFIHSLVICHILYFLLLPLLVHSPDPYEHFNKIVTIIIALLIYGLGYRGLMQPEIFTGSTDETDKSKIERIKYEKSALNNNYIETYFKELKQVIEYKKLYKDPELTLNDLANELKLSTHNLSQIINIKTSNNFYDFINSYRVEEVKKLLADPEKVKKYTLLSLAFDAGFNSKATFNKMFKKVTGLTPSEFVKLN